MSADILASCLRRPISTGSSSQDLLETPLQNMANDHSLITPKSTFSQLIIQSVSELIAS